jgi:Protein of unknown function (DUF3987)
MSREHANEAFEEARECDDSDWEYEAWKQGRRGTWPDPDMRLVADDRPPAPALDKDALPVGWDDWIAKEAAARACPPDYVAAALIGAASAWIGNARRIAATATWNEPAHLWIAAIGAPSSGKTPALEPVIQVSWVLEREAEPAWREECAKVERDAEVAKAREEAWRKTLRDAVGKGAAPPNRPTDAEQPAAPPRPRVIANDSTTEETQRLLADAPRGLLYVRDELAGWLGGFDRYGGTGADRAFFLECWNGGAYVCDRVRYHGAPIRIEHAALAILGGIVPDRLRSMLAGDSDGLAERFIYVWPDLPAIQPLADVDGIEAAQRRKQLMDAARRLRSLPMGADDHGTPAPIARPLEDDGRVLFDEVRRYWMEIARKTSGLNAGWAGKNPGRVLRLALIFEYLTWAARGGAEPVTVSADAIARAASYLEYAAGMLDRMTAGLALTEPEADAATIARHILATRPVLLNERALYQTAGFAWARDGKRRAAALAVLEQAGWIRRPPGVGLGRRRGDWEVSLRVLE